MKKEKQEGIFIPYEVKEDYELKIRQTLGLNAKIINNMLFISSQISNSQEELIIKSLKLAFQVGYSLGIADEEDEEYLIEEFKKLVDKVMGVDTKVDL